MVLGYRRALTLAAVLVLPAAALASEPSEREVQQAVKAYYDSVTESNKQRAKDCAAKRGDPITCMSVAMSGNLAIEIRSVRKRGCEKRRAKDEYACTFSAVADVQSSNQMMEDQMRRHLAGERTYRFRRSGNGVSVLPWEDE